MPGPEVDASADLALLLDAAQGAGAIAARHFGRAQQSWDKGGGQGPVTEADLAVNEHLHQVLVGARPGYGWLSEESDPLTSPQTRTQRPATFVIDPIDGTRAFMDGQDTFAHALAVVVAGRPVAAVVHLPLRALTYSAIVGQGAWLNGQPIRVSDRRDVDGARVLAARPNLDARNWRGGVAPAVDRHFRPSLAWRLALVGEGAFDAMLTLRPAWDWDIAAAALIASEAGATLTDRAGAPLVFNRAEARNLGVLAAPAALHAALLDRIAPLTPQPAP